MNFRTTAGRGTLSSPPWHAIESNWRHGGWRGCEHGKIKNNTPELFGRALELARAYVDRHPKQAPLITINSWNEWTEGSYLEPDDMYGYGYLEAVKRVFGPVR